MAEFTYPKDYKFYEAITSLDGRFRGNIEHLAKYFSEKSTIQKRLFIEIEYLLALNQIQEFTNINAKQESEIRNIYKNITNKDIEKIINIDLEINHDTKAIEYFIRQKLHDINLEQLSPLIHFGLTSADIDNNVQSLILSEFLKEIYLPQLEKIIENLKNLATQTRSSMMIARTHGQMAVPTTMGKELINFVMRIQTLKDDLSGIKIEGKLTGAVGNFNALHFANPGVDWLEFSGKFLIKLGLKPNLFTTQILPYDNYLKIFSNIKLINLVLIALSQDIWRYISDNYFVVKVSGKEIGSSTMPQKVNPIDFEMAESYLMLANSIFNMFESKLPSSRLQRDLVDKYMIREAGLTFGSITLAYESISTGLKKLSFNDKFAKEELLQHWEVVSEGIQTMLRTLGDEKAYEKLKKLTRGKKITEEIISEFIKSLKLKPKEEKKLLNLSPLNYIGLSKDLVDLALSKKTDK